MTFEEKVRNFLLKHKPGLAYLAPRIAKKFYHDQSACLEHLHNRFVKGAPSTYDPNKVVPKASQSYVELGKSEDETPEVEESVNEDAVDTAEESHEEVAAESTEASIDLDKGEDAEVESTQASPEAEEVAEATDEENKN